MVTPMGSDSKETYMIPVWTQKLDFSCLRSIVVAWLKRASHTSSTISYHDILECNVQITCGHISTSLYMKTELHNNAVDSLSACFGNELRNGPLAYLHPAEFNLCRPCCWPRGFFWVLRRRHWLRRCPFRAWLMQHPDCLPQHVDMILRRP